MQLRRPNCSVLCDVRLSLLCILDMHGEAAFESVDLALGCAQLRSTPRGTHVHKDIAEVLLLQDTFRHCFKESGGAHLRRPSRWRPRARRR